MSRVDDLLVSELVVQRSGSSGFKYDVRVNVVDISNTHPGTIPDREDVKKEVERQLYCLVPKCKESKGKDQLFDFEKYKAIDALSVIVDIPEVVQTNNIQIYPDKTKAVVVINDTDFPPPRRGVLAISSARTATIQKLELKWTGADLKYSLTAIDTDGETLYPKMKTNLQSNENKKIICFTRDENNGMHDCSEVDFQDSVLWNLQEGIAFFVDDTPGDEIDNNIKQGLMLLIGHQ